MKSTIFKSIGTSEFILKYPWLFISSTFIILEVSLYIMGYSPYIDKFNEFPLKTISVSVVRLLILITLTYSFKHFKQSK